MIPVLRPFLLPKWYFHSPVSYLAIRFFVPSYRSMVGEMDDPMDRLQNMYVELITR